MKIHSRFFLSHDNSHDHMIIPKKYQYFMKKYAPSYAVTGKGARKCNKKCYVTYVIFENL